MKKAIAIIFAPGHQEECEQLISENNKLEQIFTPNPQGDIWMSK